MRPAIFVARDVSLRLTRRPSMRAAKGPGRLRYASRALGRGAARSAVDAGRGRPSAPPWSIDRHPRLEAVVASMTRTTSASVKARRVDAALAAKRAARSAAKKEARHGGDRIAEYVLGRKTCFRPAVAGPPDIRRDLPDKTQTSRRGKRKMIGFEVPAEARSHPRKRCAAGLQEECIPAEKELLAGKP